MKYLLAVALALVNLTAFGQPLKSNVYTTNTTAAADAHVLALNSTNRVNQTNIVNAGVSGGLPNQGNVVTNGQDHVNFPHGFFNDIEPFVFLGGTPPNLSIFTNIASGGGTITYGNFTWNNLFQGPMIGNAVGLTNLQATNLVNGPIPTGLLTSGTTNTPGHLLVGTTNAQGVPIRDTTFNASALTNYASANLVGAIPAGLLPSIVVTSTVTPNGIVDQTATLQAAAATPNSLLWFAPGDYYATQIYLTNNVIIQGNGATLHQLSMLAITSNNIPGNDWIDWTNWNALINCFSNGNQWIYNLKLDGGKPSNYHPGTLVPFTGPNNGYFGLGNNFKNNIGLLWNTAGGGAVIGCVAQNFAGEGFFGASSADQGGYLSPHTAFVGNRAYTNQIGCYIQSWGGTHPKLYGNAEYNNILDYQADQCGIGLDDGASNTKDDDCILTACDLCLNMTGGNGNAGPHKMFHHFVMNHSTTGFFIAGCDFLGCDSFYEAVTPTNYINIASVEFNASSLSGILVDNEHGTRNPCVWRDSDVGGMLLIGNLSTNEFDSCHIYTGSPISFTNTTVCAYNCFSDSFGNWTTDVFTNWNNSGTYFGFGNHRTGSGLVEPLVANGSGLTGITNAASIGTNTALAGSVLITGDGAFSHWSQSFRWKGNQLFVSNGVNANLVLTPGTNATIQVVGASGTNATISLNTNGTVTVQGLSAVANNGTLIQVNATPTNATLTAVTTNSGNVAVSTSLKLGNSQMGRALNLTSTNANNDSLIVVGYDGTVTATNFSGNGSSLTALNASQLTSGTVPVGVLANAVTNGNSAPVLLGAATSGTKLSVLNSDTSNPIIFGTNNGAGSFIPLYFCLAPNMTAGQYAYSFIGKQNATSNGVSMLFLYQGNANAGNSISFSPAGGPVFWTMTVGGDSVQNGNVSAKTFTGSGSGLTNLGGLFTVTTNSTQMAVTNLQSYRGTFTLNLAFDDVTGGNPSCTIWETNSVFTNFFGTISPNLSGLTLVGTVSVTNFYSFPAQTNSTLTIVDTSSGGATVRKIVGQVWY